MPNDCDNLLTITTVPADYEALKALLTNDKGELTFTKAVPRPDGEYWYDWNIEHWGTKRDAYDGSRDLAESPEQIRFYFATAKSPAVPFVESLSAMFPASTFVLEYLETEFGIGGEVACVGGVITKDVEDDDAELIIRELSFGRDGFANPLLWLLAHGVPWRKSVRATIKAYKNYTQSAA